jgi:hypothetical protein
MGINNRSGNFSAPTTAAARLFNSGAVEAMASIV